MSRPQTLPGDQDKAEKLWADAKLLDKQTDETRRVDERKKMRLTANAMRLEARRLASASRK